MTLSIDSAAKQCWGQCFCDFSWPFPHGHKIAAFFPPHIVIKAEKRQTGPNGSLFLLSGKRNFPRRSPLHPANLLLLQPYVDYIFPVPSYQEGLESEGKTIVIGLPYTTPPKLSFLKVWKMKDTDIG